MRTSTSMPKRSLRAVVAGVVTAVLAGLLLPLSPLLPAPAALAAKASSGSSALTPTIEWISWASHGVAVENNARRVISTTIAGQPVTITCTLTNLSGGIVGYSPGNWRGDGFDEMFNSGSTGTANTFDVGLQPNADGATRSFNVSCSGAASEQNLPLGGLVFADAEQSGDLEFVGATAPSGATWRIIDRYRAPGCSQSTYAYRAANTNRLELYGPTTATCDGGPTAIAYADGALSLTNVTMRGGGLSAIAIGVMLPTDFGDAPQSYGLAGANLQPQLTGGTVDPTSGAWSSSNRGRDVFASTFAMADIRSSSTVGTIGTTVDSELTPASGATASGDDSTTQGRDDEDATFGGSSAALAPSVKAAESYTTTVSCTGTGSVRGWIDWHRDGSFAQLDDASAVSACQSGAASLTWTVPVDATSGATFLRLRIARVGTSMNPTGITVGGEVEDHPITVSVEVPRLLLTKTSTVPVGGAVRPGDVIDYTVTVRNTGAAMFMAEVVDDLSGVVGNATLNRSTVRATGASGSASVNAAGDRITWTPSGFLSIFASGATLELRYSVTVDPAARPGASLDNGVTASGGIFQRISESVTYSLPVAIGLRATHSWIVDGVPFAEGRQPDGLTAAASATGPVTAGGSLPWNTVRDGYAPRDTTTLSVTIGLASGMTCTAQTAATIGGSAHTLASPIVLNAALTDVVVTTTVTCTTALTLRNTVDGSEAATSWTLSATPSSGAAITGTTGASGAVRADVAYTLGQSAGPAHYVAGAWSCRVAGTTTAVAVANGAVRVPLGKHVECSVAQATARIQLLATVTPANGSLQPSMFTLTAAPAPLAGALLTATNVQGSSIESSANLIEVRPGHVYALSQSSDYAALGMRLERKTATGWETVADPSAVVMPAAGHTAVYRFVNRPVPALSLPITGGVGADGFVVGGAAVLLLASAVMILRARRRRLGDGAPA